MGADAGVALKTESRLREEIRKKIQAEVELIRDRTDAARPLPSLKLPFCPALLRCQAPNVTGRQCGRPSNHKSQVVELVGGRKKLVEHDTCWQHVAAARLRPIRGGKSL